MEQAQKICIEMLEQRGCTIQEVQETKIFGQDPDGSKLCVFFIHNQFGTDSMKNILGLLNKLDTKHVLVLLQNSITNQAKTSIAELKHINFETFFVKELQVNITKHRLQPKSFEKLSKEEANIFTRKYGRKIPRMRSTDTIAKFYNYRSGDIIKVERLNDHITYRIII